MTKKTKLICTPKNLARAIRQAPEKQVRQCLISIAEEAYVTKEGKLELYKDLGSDFIGEVVNHLSAYEFSPSYVICSICHGGTQASTAHLHQGKWIGECCWDERLKASE